MFHDFLNYLSHETKLWSTLVKIEDLEEIYVDEIYGFAIRFFESLGIFVQYGEMRKEEKSETEDRQPFYDFFNFYSVLDKKAAFVKDVGCFEKTPEQMRHHIILKCFGMLYDRDKNESEISIQ